MTANSQNSEVCEQTEIPQNQKGLTALSALRKLIQKIYSQNG